MSYFFEAIAGIGELIESASAFAGSAVEAGTGSELLGQTASTLTKGTVNTAIGEGVKSGVVAGYDSVYGEGSSGRDTAKAIATASAIGKQQSSFFQDPFSGYNSVGVINTKKQTNNTIPPRVQREDRTIKPEPVMNKNYIEQVVSNIPSDASVGQSFSAIVNAMNTGIDPNRDSNVYNLPLEKTFAEPMYKNPREAGQQVGEIIGKVIVAQHANEGLTINDALKQITSSNPMYNWIVNKLFDYKSNATPEPSSVPDIYNGRSLNIDNFRINTNPYTGLKEYSCPDETGTVQTWIEDHSYVVVPTIYGVWMGINSRNDDVPKYEVLSNGDKTILDLCSFMHDVSYKDNYTFHKDSDDIYINRLKNNMDRMTLYEQFLAKFAIRWFSTAGAMLAHTRGSLEPKVAKQPIMDESKDDLFPHIFPEAVDTQDYIEHRYEFHNAIETALQKVYSTESPLAVPLNSSGQVYILELI